MDDKLILANVEHAAKRILGGRRDLIDDAVQNTREILLHEADRLASHPKPEALVRLIARQRALDLLRNEASQQSLAQRVRDAVDSEEDADQHERALEQLALLRAFLPSAFVQVLELEARSMTGVQISARLGITHTAYRQRKSRMFANIRAQLGPLLDDAAGDPRAYGGGEYLCRAGDAAGSLLFLKQGAVEVIDPERGPLAQRGANNIVGELALLGHARERTADLRAVEPTLAIAFPYWLFERTMSNAWLVWDRFRELREERTTRAEMS